MPQPVKRPAPLSIRLSETERAALTRRAEGVGLSTYVKSILFFGEAAKGRRTSSADRVLLAQVLGQLGASGLASRLRLLADAAESGSLVADEATTAQLREASDAVGEMRDLLRAALSGRTVRPAPAKAAATAPDLDRLFNNLNKAWGAE